MQQQFGEEIYLTKTEVSKAIKSLKTGKAQLAEHAICPKLLKAMNNFGVRWLTRVFPVRYHSNGRPIS